MARSAVLRYSGGKVWRIHAANNPIQAIRSGVAFVVSGETGMTLVLAAIAALILALLATHTIDAIDQLRETLMASTQEIVDALTEQLVAVQREIVGKLADLQGQIDAAGVAEQVDLSELTAAVQSLDDIVPDQPAE